MNNLIIHPEFLNLKNAIEKLRDILTEKIAKKDQLIFHECKNIETTYMLKLGYLDFKIFETKLNIRKLKREIALIQKQINLEKEVDLEFIKNQLEVEFEKFILELEEKGAELNIALKRSELKTLSNEDSIELKKIYKELILKLHPDLNDNIGKKEEDLFFQVMDAYEDGNLEKIKVLKVLASDISTTIEENSENSIDKLKNDINLLEIYSELIDKEIDDIKSSYPYNKKDLINDDEKLEKNKKVLEEDLANNIEILDNYKKKLDNLLKTIK
ncbi:MAG: hypothetical protein FWE58_06305 [Methanobrevibacter sp.]|nr:hypothetical protein [Methanobrevibacter sp.]